jgi:hypothetical protein
MKKPITYDHSQILQNRADLGGARLPQCAEQEPDLIFALKQGETEFSVNLKTLVDCLQIAEQQGYLPTIDTEWWLNVYKRYGIGW